MSFIDVFRHEHIGFIAGVPIYLPEQDIAGEFEANANSILLGGGSGELDAWVLAPEDVLFAVVDHHLFASGNTNKIEPESKNEGDFYDFMETIFPNDVYSPIDRPTWTGDEWFSIMNEALEEGYTKEGYGSIERWFCVKLGEVIFNRLPSRLEVSLNDNALEIIKQASESNTFPKKSI